MQPHLVALLMLLAISLFFAILNLTFFPLLFWLIYIPDMEKKIAQKFHFNPAYNYIPFGKFIFGYFEIATSIVTRYLSLKLFKNQNKIKMNVVKVFEKTNYDIFQVSRSAIVMSFFAETSILISIINIVAAFAISKIYN